MKEFNLEKAKAGDPVVTRCGKAWKYIGICSSPIRPIVGEIDLNVAFWQINGRHSPYQAFGFEKPEDDPYDLFMAPVKKQEWRNIQYNLDRTAPTGQFYTIDDIPFESEEAAQKYAEHEQLPNYVKSILIREWEE